MARTQYTAIVSEAQAETRQLVTVTLSTPANARTRVPVIQSRDDPSTLMATVTLNDPQRLNALSAAMMFQLNARLAELSPAWPSCRAIREFVQSSSSEVAPRSVQAVPWT
jgi:hypothetical protein